MDQKKYSPSIQEQIDKIIKTRKEKCNDVKEIQSFWEKTVKRLEAAKHKCTAAERQQNSLLENLSARLENAERLAQKQAADIQKIYDRYNRDVICIGVGGAARMGKSTFLQKVTGLTDQQIPTSDKGFTTAGRSLIVNDSKEQYAIADMHSEETFLQNVLVPMCKSVDIEPPRSLENFAQMSLQAEGNQERRDIIQRLEHVQKKLSEIRKELTGEKRRRIAIDSLRDYVAYPTDTYNKAGKFMAVENIVIHATFPNADIEQLQVVDLPGLGEAGRDLAEVQTNGLSEVCDITLLIKKPEEHNAEWKACDSQALDVLAASIPLLEDLSLYTVLLMNRDNRQEQSDTCLANIKKHLHETSRHLKIMDYNVTDKEAIIKKAIPEILEFLAKSLPEIDRVIWQKAQKESSRLQKDICKTLEYIEKELQKVIPDANPDAEREALKEKLVKSLIAGYAETLKEKAQGPDEEWNKKIEEAADKVKEWANTGCGFGNMEEFIDELKWKIDLAHGIPTDFINQIRIDFRRQWDIMDDYLEKRIEETLCEFLEHIRTETYNFVPRKDECIRKQLNDTADKLMSAAQSTEERATMENFAKPLRRLASFELRSNFLFEPQLQSFADELRQARLNSTEGHASTAESLAAAISGLLHKAIEDYSTTMKSIGNQKEKIEQLIKSVEDANINQPGLKKKIIDELKEKMQSLTFSPHRILAAVIINETDSFLRFRNIDDALRIWLKRYKSEMREAPTTAIQTAVEAQNDIENLKNYIKNPRSIY